MRKTNDPAALADHAGYLSPRYSKAQRTVDALVESGRALLRSRPLDGMSVQDLCAGAQVTTGAFYGRFKSKQAFFGALQALAAQDIRRASQRRLAELDEGRWTLDEVAHLLVRNMRLWMLRHQGVLRATLLQQGEGPGSWAGFRQLAQDFVNAVAPRIGQLLGGQAPAEARELRIRFGFQMVVGTLVNAAVNNPGPLALADPRMDKELARALALYLKG